MCCAGIYVELTVQQINALLLINHARYFHHVVADGRVRAVRTEHHVKFDLCSEGEPVFVFKQSRAFVKIGMNELVIEE